MTAWWQRRMLGRCVCPCARAGPRMGQPVCPVRTSGATVHGCVDPPTHYNVSSISVLAHYDVSIHPCLRPAVVGLTAGAGQASSSVCLSAWQELIWAVLCCKVGACTIAFELLMWHHVCACNVVHELTRWRHVPAGVPIFPNDVFHHALFE